VFGILVVSMVTPVCRTEAAAERSPTYVYILRSAHVGVAVTSTF
jgi:hypothetical protein